MYLNLVKNNEIECMKINKIRKIFLKIPGRNSFIYPIFYNSDKNSPWVETFSINFKRVLTLYKYIRSITNSLRKCHFIMLLRIFQFTTTTTKVTKQKSWLQIFKIKIERNTLGRSYYYFIGIIKFSISLFLHKWICTYMYSQILK